MTTQGKRRNPPDGGSGTALLTSSVDELYLAAMERGAESLQTGRYLVTFKEGAGAEGLQALAARGRGMQVADARDFKNQAVTLEDLGDADALLLPEIGVALLSGDAAEARGMSAAEFTVAAGGPIAAVEPECFVFAQQAAPGGYPQGFGPAAEAGTGEYLRGFLHATETIAKDLHVNVNGGTQAVLEPEEEVTVLGATWGLLACKVPQSKYSGAGIRVAVLDTGVDLGHPDFARRTIVTQTFAGQPVQDLNGHGTHLIGTACGPKAPPGSIPRYGIGYKTAIYVGKVLSNSGAGTTGSVLAGMNWAITNRCPVIALALGSQAPVQAAYTAAGQAAIVNGCLMMAPAGGSGTATGAPANSPTILAVAALDRNLHPSAFSNLGKIEIAAPGQDIFSSLPLPTRYGIKSGTSCAVPHVAGCAALWAETSPSLRGLNLWRKLLATALPLPFPPARVGAGLVQAP